MFLSRPLARLLMLVCFSVFLRFSGYAQITNVTNDQATPIPGVGHDYIKMLSETVQPSNGQLSIRIEVPTHPGRGTTVPFAYVYNSAGLHHVVAFIDGKAGWVTDMSPLQGSGWSTSTPTISAIQATNSMNFPGPPPYTGSCVYFTGYVFQDSSGARHSLPIVTAQSTDAGSPNHCGQVGGPGNVLLGGDGTYNASTTAPPADAVPSSPPSVTVVGPDGTVYSCGLGSSPVYSGWTQYFLGTCTVGGDRNGNVLTSQPTVSTTTTPANPPFQNFSFNFVPAPSNPPQANCFGISSATGPGQTNANQSINFPNGVYQFQYHPVYGTVSQINYPSGGFVKYDWGLNPISEAVLTFDNQGLNCAYEYDTPAVTHRYVSFDGANVALEQDFRYSPTQWQPNAVWTSKQTIVTTIDCARNNFNCTGAPSFTTTYNYVSSGGQTGQEIAVESSVVYGDFNGNTLLTETKGWAGERLLCDLRTLDNGQISGVFYQYGSGDQVTDKKEYDYGLITSTSGCFTGVNGGLPPSGVNATRETAVTYQSFPATPGFPGAPSIFDRPCDVAIHIGSQGSPIADTHFLYDGGTSACGAPGTAATAAVSNLVSGTHDETNYGPSSTAPRGNATKIDRTCLPSCGHIISTASFDETGQPVSVTDPKGNVTQYSYTDSFSDTGPSGNTNTFLTKITLPTTSNGVSHIESFKYSYASGQLTFATDQNNQTTQYIYNDPLFRPKEIDYPDGGKTSFAYNDSLYNPSTPSPSVTTTKAMTSSTNLVTVAASDGLGHVVETLVMSDTACAAHERVDTTYDGIGHVRTSSNPYCATSDATYGTTSYLYDALGRTKQINRQDGSLATTSYTGPCATSTDEARKSRESCTDGLGRLTQVVEDPSPGKNYETDYGYDGLDNLTSVTQKGGSTTNWRRRAFQYDALSRLISATNPESGTANYTYDPDGNLIKKVSPAPNQTGTSTVTTCYGDWSGTSCNGATGYDALNRMLKKSFSDGTPTATFTYDSASPTGVTGITNTVGRLVVAANSNAQTVNSYDKMGRIAQQWQCSPINCGTGGWFTFSYVYNLDGTEKSINPAAFGCASNCSDGGFTLTQGYDSAGRVNSLMSSITDLPLHPATLVSGVTYNASGQITAMTYANGLTETRAYNSRLQPCRLNLNSSSVTLANCTSAIPSGNVQDFNYGFNVGTTDNGNVASAIGSGQQIFDRTYTYDSLNRLFTMADSASGQVCKGLQWTYDPWGNRTAQSVTAGACGTSSVAVNNNNQFIGAPYQYDAAGNMTHDASHSYTFDAENHITKVDGGATSTYLYDANGRRVEQITPHGGFYNSLQAHFWYDTSGHIRTIWDQTGDWMVDHLFLGGEYILSYSTEFVFKDLLGSTRILTHVDKSIEDSLDYLPFGEQQTGTSYTSLKFTGKEHDIDSGLDNFGARYMGSSLGRFMSPDPLYIEAHRLADPQSLNLYSYVRNNPLNLTDSTGLLVDVNCSQVSAEKCQQTVTDLNNRKDAQFQVTRDDSGQLNVASQNGDSSQWSKSEQALYNAVTNGESVGTLNVVSNDPSFDFEKSNGPGQNTLDRSDLNALNGANSQLSGEIIAHAAIESYVSGSYGYTDATSDRAHDFANNFFSVQYNPRLWTPFRDPATGLVLGASNRFYFSKPNVDVMTRVRTSFVTPIPFADWSKSTALPPRNVTNVTIVPAVQ